jgi:hypothetical protein
VATVPVATTPNINDGQTLSIAQVGSRIVLGGTFTSVSPPADKTATVTFPRTNVLAFDAVSGAVDTGFVPVVNGTVYRVVPGPVADTVYLAGAFSTVDGVAAKSIALVSTVTGALVPGFTAPKMDGIAYAAALSNGRLYLGGSFTELNNLPHGGLATLNPTTGAVDPFMSIQLSGHHNFTGAPGEASGAVGPRQLSITPDGNQMVVIGNFTTVAGNATAADQIVRIRLDGASAAVEAWRTLAFTAACDSAAFDTYMQDVDFSPDGSYFVIAATGVSGTNTDGSKALCDSTSRFQTSDTSATSRPVWVDYTGHDTPESIAVTGSAVYVGGHQRWMNNPLGHDAADLGAVPRPGIAALDPDSGVPLTWNPGRNPRGSGAAALLATPTGLWVGSDTTFVGDHQYYRGRIAFFPVAGGAPNPDVSVDQLPANVYLAGTLTGGDTLRQRSFTGTVVGSTTTVSTSVPWSSARGTFMVGPWLYYGSTDGNLYRSTFDGTTVGSAQLVDPYEDPLWENVLTGSGGTYAGVKSGLYGAEMQNVTSMFYSAGKLYFTLDGQPNLYSRSFNPDSGIITEDETSTSGADLSNGAGAFLSGGSLYYASRVDGSLHRVAFAGGATNPATDTVVSSPSSDGNDWRSRGMFLFGSLSPTTALFSSSCTAMTCTFDATASTPSGKLTFAWDFGDGGTGTGINPTHLYSVAGAHSVTLTVTDSSSGTDSVTHGITTKAPHGSFTALTPCRVFDTRGAAGSCATSPAAHAARLGAGTVKNVKLFGVAAIPSNATAVVLNITAVHASTKTFVTVWPGGKARPAVSDLNVNSAAAVPNLVTVQLGADGSVNFSNNQGTVDLLADVAGFYSPTSPAGYSPLTPCRVFDTRGAAGGCSGSPAPAVLPLGPGGTKTVTVAGVGGVPASATAVVMNVTATRSTTTTFVTVWPGGQARPAVSNLNVTAAQAVPNLVLVPLGAGGTVSFGNNVGSVDLLADLAGYFSPTSASGYTALTPCRILDTRGTTGSCSASAAGTVRTLGAGQTLSLRVVGVGGIPLSATALVLNVTADNATASTFVTVFPGATTRPVVSNLNVASSAPRPNMVVVPIGVDGSIQIYNAAGSVNVLADLAGYYSTS